MRGFILTPTYRVVRGAPEVHLYGVLESGEPCLLIDDRPRPHFFVLQRDVAQLQAVAPGLTVEASDWRSLRGDAVATISVGVPSDVPPLRRKLEEARIACLEADVRFAYRYLIDRGIRGAFEVDGVGETRPRLGRVFRNPVVRPVQWTPRLKVLSIDIETSVRADRLYSIGLYAHDFEHVILVHGPPVPNAEVVRTEREALCRFLAYLDQLDPDVITGWNVVDFDLAVLSRLARRHGVRFTVGRSDDEFDLRKDASFTRESRAIVFGRQVLDGLALMRGAFIRLDDYRLETAAQTFLGKGKLIAGDSRHSEIERLYHDDPARLAAYNLEDAHLVLEILDRTGLVELAVERSLLTGMQLDRVSAAIASVDSLYLNALRRRGIVAPSVSAVARDVQITGGYVMESKPGLYRNVLVFDFKSLYPSIIRTFNIDPLTYLPADGLLDTETHGDAVPPAAYVRAPNGACFRRDLPGIIPELLGNLATERERAKSSRNAVKANAIKILMNSFYGVLGAEASRLFSPEVANAVTHFGQYVIRRAAECAEQKGYDVIYGDTDSLFVASGEADAQRAQQLGEQLRVAIGTAVAERIRTEFGCESLLELELEKLYLRFFLPEVRGGKVGSKKRYAGLVSTDGREVIEFVGLESVRRDWSEVSKRFQGELLQRVFHDQPVEEFIKTFIADLRAGRFDEQLSYKKAIRKDLDAYTKTTPPHVRAARRQSTPPGRLITYVMTLNGPEPAGECTAPPDYTHYIEHQLAPVADAILRFLGQDFASIVGLKQQLALF